MKKHMAFSAWFTDSTTNVEALNTLLSAGWRVVQMERPSSPCAGSCCGTSTRYLLVILERET